MGPEIFVQKGSFWQVPGRAQKSAIFDPFLMLFEKQRFSCDECNEVSFNLLNLMNLIKDLKVCEETKLAQKEPFSKKPKNSDF